jgi:hypothetical protein
MKSLLHYLLFLITATTLLADGKALKPDNWHFNLDPTEWKIGHRQGTPQQAIVEHIKNEEKIESWSMLVTEFVIFGQFTDAHFKQGLENTRSMLASSSKDFQWNIIRQSEGDVTFEWSHKGSGTYPPQHEIKRMKMGNFGIYFLSYAEKTTDVDASTREKWIEIIENAKLTPTN